MKFLITGGAGFVGTHLIRRLLKEKNMQIWSVDDYSSGNTENHIDDPRVTYIHESTLNINHNAQILEVKPEVVVHLGEYSRIVPSFEEIRKCHDSNFVGTFQVIEFCKNNCSKLVYAGSSSKFGNNEQDQHLSPYAWMKAKNIELIKNYNKWFGLEYAIAYLYNVYGPGQIDHGKMATIIGIFQQQVLNNQPLTVVGSGNQERDFTHVDDVAAGLALVALFGKGDDYMLGFGKKRTVLEVAEAFEHPIVFVPERTGERLSGQAMTEKAFQELGWKAKLDIIDYIKTWKLSLKDNVVESWQESKEQ